MEGCPKSLMINFDLKEPGPTEDIFEAPLKQYIEEFYQENGNAYSNEIQQITQLRKSISSIPRDKQGCCILRKYYTQLHYLQSRFPMGEGGVAATTFAWYDLYNFEPVIFKDIRFEQACLLFSLGGLYSQLASNESRLSDESLRTACTHFQSAAGAYQFLKENFMLDQFPDMCSDILSMKTSVMLGQGLECILEKSIRDDKNSSLIARISTQIVKHFDEAIDLLSKSGTSELGSSTRKTWSKILKIKKLSYKAITYMYQSNDAHEKEKYGVEVGYLQSASNLITEANKLLKKQPEPLIETVHFVNDVIMQKLESAKKDNDFVYHLAVPESSALEEVAGVNLVKPLPFKPVDPDVSGPDIFHKLVPMKAHESSSLYSDEKDNVFRKISKDIEDKDIELGEFMSAMRFEHILNPKDDALPDELLAKNTFLRNNPDLIPKVNNDIEELGVFKAEVESILRDVHEKLKEDGLNISDVEEHTKLKANAEKCQASLNEANHTNDELLLNYNKLESKVKFLSGDSKTILKSLPSQVVIEAPTDEPVVQRIREILGKVDKMKLQRKDLQSKLREQLNNDDITSKLVTLENQDKQAFFLDELKKHDETISYINQNLVAQGNIMQALTEVNAKYATTRQQVIANKQKFDEEVQLNINSVHLFLGVKDHISEGLHFFRLFKETLVAFQNKVSSFYSSHKKKDVPKQVAPLRPTARKPDSLTASMRPPSPQQFSATQPFMAASNPHQQQLSLRIRGPANPQLPRPDSQPVIPGSHPNQHRFPNASHPPQIRAADHSRIPFHSQVSGQASPQLRQQPPDQYPRSQMIDQTFGPRFQEQAIGLRLPNQQIRGPIIDRNVLPNQFVRPQLTNPPQRFERFPINYVPSEMQNQAFRPTMHEQHNRPQIQAAMNYKNFPDQTFRAHGEHVQHSLRDRNMRPRFVNQQGIPDPNIRPGIQRLPHEAFHYHHAHHTFPPQRFDAPVRHPQDRRYPSSPQFQPRFSPMDQMRARMNLPRTQFQSDMLNNQYLSNHLNDCNDSNSLPAPLVPEKAQESSTNPPFAQQHGGQSMQSPGSVPISQHGVSLPQQFGMQPNVVLHNSNIQIPQQQISALHNIPAQNILHPQSLVHQNAHASPHYGTQNSNLQMRQTPNELSNLQRLTQNTAQRHMQHNVPPSLSHQLQMNEPRKPVLVREVSNEKQPQPSHSPIEKQFTHQQPSAIIQPSAPESSLPYSGPVITCIQPGGVLFSSKPTMSPSSTDHVINNILGKAAMATPSSADVSQLGFQQFQLQQVVLQQQQLIAMMQNQQNIQHNEEKSKIDTLQTQILNQQKMIEGFMQKNVDVKQPIEMKSKSDDHQRLIIEQQQLILKMLEVNKEEEANKKPKESQGKEIEPDKFSLIPTKTKRFTDNVPAVVPLLNPFYEPKIDAAIDCRPVRLPVNENTLDESKKLVSEGCQVALDGPIDITEIVNRSDSHDKNHKEKRHSNKMENPEVCPSDVQDLKQVEDICRNDTSNKSDISVSHTKDFHRNIVVDPISPPDITHSSSDITHSSPDVTHSSPNVNHGLPKITNSPPEITHSSSNVTQSPPDVTHSFPIVNYGPPEITNSPPEITHSSSEITQSPPDVIHSSPNVNHSHSEITNSPPEITHSSHEITHSSSDITQSPPDVTHGSSNVNNDLPKITHSPPEITHSSSDITQSPDVTHSSPNVNHDLPKITQSSPEITHSPSQIAVDMHKISLSTQDGKGLETDLNTALVQLEDVNQADPPSGGLVDHRPDLARQLGRLSFYVGKPDECMWRNYINELSLAVEKLQTKCKTLCQSVKRNIDGFQMIWMDLAKVESMDVSSFSSNVGEQNITKNRYRDILPWDHTRVKLSSLPNDYINASHVENLTPLSPRYIATQGPIPQTFEDFWTMVWEQKSTVIVMLTNEVEGHKLKCHPYWKRSCDEAGEFGNMVVILMDETAALAWKLRTFTILNKQTEETRLVKHLQFTSWPDYGTPETPDDLLLFIKEVNRCHMLHDSSSAYPIILHCSAGVGRTGSFCCVYSAICEIQGQNGLIEVPGVIRKLRHNRPHMVQRKEQMIFCYQAILYFSQQFISTELENLAVRKDSLPGDEPLFSSASSLSLGYHLKQPLSPKCIDAHESSVKSPADLQIECVKNTDVDNDSKIAKKNDVGNECDVSTKNDADDVFAENDVNNITDVTMSDAEARDPPKFKIKADIFHSPKIPDSQKHDSNEIYEKSID